MAETGKERKRKREAVRHEGSRKKTAVAGSNAGSVSTIKISVHPKANEWGPIIGTAGCAAMFMEELMACAVSAPGLALPANLSLTPYSNESAADSQLLLRNSSHPRLDYIAREEPAGSAEGLLAHYIGIFDPATSTLDVIPARKMALRGTLRSEEESLREEEEERTAKPMNALRQELGMMFGTKKAKKAIASLTENAIGPAVKNQTAEEITRGAKDDPLAAAVLDSMSAATLTMPDRAALQQVVDDAKPRPKANDAAETPADVYPFEALIPKHDMKDLLVREWQEKAKAGEGVNTSSRFVSNRLHAIAVRDDIRNLKALRYILLLVEFLGSLKGGGRNAKKLPIREELQKRLDVPDTLISSVTRRFASKGEMPKWNIDNLITHACALALTVDNFETDTHDLREDLRLDQSAMSQYFRETGARVGNLTEKEREKRGLSKAEAAVHKIARLKLPLEFPKQRVMAASKRR